MKFISSRFGKYFGIKTKTKVYYVCWNHPDHRDWGYDEFWHDGPYKRLSLYFISFQWHWED